MIITLTVTKQGGNTQGTLSRGFNTAWITNLRPTTEGNLSSAARFDYGEDKDSRQTFEVSETYSAALTAIQNADREAGAELTANKNAASGYVGIDSSSRVRIPNTNALIESTIDGANDTASRRRSLRDATGTVPVVAEIAGTFTLTAGDSGAIACTAITANSIVVPMVTARNASTTCGMPRVVVTAGVGLRIYSDIVGTPGTPEAGDASSGQFLVFL